MNRKIKYLCIIPARSGSKRIPDKNIKNLFGKPLIAWTIEAALKSNYIDEVIVSTDSKSIIELTVKFGGKAPFIRPDYLATDDAKTSDVLIHAIDYYKNQNCSIDYIVLLQPTSPLRDYNDINNAIEFLIAKRADAVISVCEADHSPLWMNTISSDLSMVGFLNKKILNKRSQELETFYRINGAIYICRADIYKKEKNFFIKNSYAYIMDNEKSVDIDTEFDFKLAEFLLDKNKIYHIG